jgi:hypothetical protein
VTHTTIQRWVQRCFPEFEKRWRRYVGQSADAGGWMRPIKRFVGNGFICISLLRSAMKRTRVRMKTTWDAYPASHRAARELKEVGDLPRRVRFAPANT